MKKYKCSLALSEVITADSEHEAVAMFLDEINLDYGVDSLVEVEIV